MAEIWSAKRPCLCPALLQPPVSYSERDVPLLVRVYFDLPRMGSRRRISGRSRDRINRFEVARPGVEHRAILNRITTAAKKRRQVIGSPSNPMPRFILNK